MTCQRNPATEKETVHFEANEERKPSKNTDSPQDKHTLKLRISKVNTEEDEETKHNVEKKDPTTDEYHSIKEKREDDNTKPRSVSESSHAKQLTNPQLHVDLEQCTGSFQSQSMLTKGKDPNNAA